ncbi:MAG: hypothetical protein ACYTDU_10035 [Planctomycetota bacterium]
MASALLILLIAQGTGVSADSTTRPDPAGVPTKVTTGLYLLDLFGIDDVNQSFTADVLLILEWKDPRLASTEGDAHRTLALSEVWHPRVQVLNQRSLSKSLPEVVTVARDGTAVYRQRLTGEFTILLHFRDFPFDKHKLALSLVSAGNTPEDVAFVAHPGIKGRSAELTLAGWSIDQGSPRVLPYDVKVLDSKLARFDMEFHIRRGSLFYLLRLIGPLLLIVLIGWGSLWIDPKNTGGQLRLGATVFLTLIAYQFAVGGLLPHVSYLTRMDRFIAGSSIIIFLTLGKAVLADHLVSNDKLDLLLRLNPVARWAYFGAILLVTAVAFWL